MRHRRRVAVLRIAVATVVLTATAGLAPAAAKLWECRWCHQQYQGDRPPPFAKCPAKEMKQNHWWGEKR
jgi:hypothetical protein